MNCQCDELFRSSNPAKIRASPITRTSPCNFAKLERERKRLSVHCVCACARAPLASRRIQSSLTFPPPLSSSETKLFRNFVLTKHLNLPTRRGNSQHSKKLRFRNISLLQARAIQSRGRASLTETSSRNAISQNLSLPSPPHGHLSNTNKTRWLVCSQQGPLEEVEIHRSHEISQISVLTDKFFFKIIRIVDRGDVFTFKSLVESRD